MRFHATFAGLAPFLLLLSSCVSAPEGAPKPAPMRAPVAAAAPPVPAPAPVEWQYRPATPGNWIYKAEGGGSVAAFVGSASSSLLALRCDSRSHRVSFIRNGVGQGVMTVRTTYGATNWPATATAASTVATRAANDSVLDQIAYSRGRFAVEVSGLEMLILPVWSEVGRVIEDCR